MAKVTFQGSPVDLSGPELKVGDHAPESFTLTANDLSPVPGSALAGKPRILVTAPSLDTPVCDLEGRRFNKEAAAIPGLEVYVISMDLPFAQKRWCGAAGVDRVKTLSDYNARSFGLAYGVLWAGPQLLARAVFVVDRDDHVRHVEYVREITTEPDYAAALAVARALVR